MNNIMNEIKNANNNFTRLEKIKSNIKKILQSIHISPEDRTKYRFLLAYINKILKKKKKIIILK